MTRTLSAIVICLAIMMIAIPSQAKLGNPARAFTDNFALADYLFSHSQAELQEIKMKHGGQITNKDESLPDLEAKYLLLAERLGMDPAKRTVQVDRDGLVSISQLEQTDSGTIQLYLQYIPAPGDWGTINWGIGLQTTAREQARTYYSMLRLAGRDLGCTAEPSLELSGSLPASLLSEERNRCLQQLAQLVGARFLEGAESEQLTSWSLFTQEAFGWMEVAGQKINLNLAMRSIPAENKTKLYIGLPLLYSDY